MQNESIDKGLNFLFSYVSSSDLSKEDKIAVKVTIARLRALVDDVSAINDNNIRSDDEAFIIQQFNALCESVGKHSLKIGDPNG